MSWRTPIAMAALAVVLGLAAQDASALALGRVNVLSAPEITAEEAASLRTSVANPDAFRAAGLEYNPAFSNVQISLQRRANGTAFLRVSSDRSINEPFVDLILEASWASGRIVRDYTLLFDPSNMRIAQAPAPSVTTPAAASAAPVAPRASAPAPVSAPATAVSAARPARTEKDKPVQAAPKDGLTVKTGDTAAALAARYKPSGVSLDQMLVSMLRASPDAFVGGNVNRLKSGAVIDMQAAAGSAPSTAEGEARQTIVAQSKDFNEFRRRLAGGAPTAVASAPGRAAGGKVQASVSEPKAQATAPDKLTLSKGSVAAKAKEDAIAKEKQAKENANRVAELSKNIQDLNKLGTTTVAKPGAPAATPAAAASAAGVKVAGTGPAPAATSSAAKIASPAATATVAATAAAPAASVAKPAASAPAVASTATAAVSATPTATAASGTTPTATATAAAPAASAPAPVAVAKPKAPPPPPPPEPTFMEGLMDNPLVLPGAGALLAGLGGLAFWRIRKKKKAVQVDSSFLESRLQPDSFFGASGGQRVDTADSGGGSGAGSSMVYSPSQLDAAGDVDPVAEADVYLAYGRDLQAEEILKEAMRTNPSRVAIHVKLMEIYAKRRDAKAFETVANEAFSLTQGSGPEWDAVSALGRDIDPGNPLYQAGNEPSGAGLAGTVKMGGSAAMAATAAFNATSTVPQQAQPAPNADFDLDLDLDFSAGGDDLVSAPGDAGMINAPVSEPTVAMRANPMSEPVVDFDMSTPAALDAVKLSQPDLASFSNGLNFSTDSSATPVMSMPTAPMSLKANPSEPAALEFDLGGLSLDLPGSSAMAASDAIDAGVSGDPLETKLALAMEFRDIGDADGARSLVAEVVEEATGALKARATKMLADLG
jgi:pilus assembly protein FimV